VRRKNSRLNVFVVFQQPLGILSVKLFTPRVLCARLKGFPLRIGYRLSESKKLEYRGYRVEKEVWRYLQPSGYNTRKVTVKVHTLDMIWQTSRRTDGQTDTGRQRRPRLRTALRGKIRLNSFAYCCWQTDEITN